MKIETARKQWAKLLREEEASEATEFVRALRWLRLSHSVLEANHRDLAIVSTIFTDTKHFVGVKHREQQEKLQFEFIRRLHNYLASVKSLVDHTRSFREKYVSDAEFDREFQEHKAAMLQNPVVSFLQRLRNPVLHSRLPNVHVVLTSPDNVTLHRQLCMDVDELLHFYDWNEAERAYIKKGAEGEEQGDSRLDIVAVVQEYQATIEAFYEWFYESVEETKAHLIEEFVDRNNEMVRLEERLRRSDTDDG